MVSGFIPRPKSFMDRIGQGFAAGASKASELIPEELIKREEQRKRMAAGQREGLNFEGLSPEMQSEAFKAKIRERENEVKTRKDLEYLQEQYRLRGDLEKNKPPKPPSAAEIKRERDEEESANVKNTAQEAFNGIVDLLKGGKVGMGSGIASSIFGGEYSKAKGEFQALSGGLEAILVDMVSRGALSKDRFNYIIKYLLPQSTDREAEIEGKLQGLAKIVGLDASKLGAKKSGSHQKKTLEDVFQ